MKKISKKNIISENIFISDNGKSFLYEGLALEEDEKNLSNIINKLKIGTLNLDVFNLTGNVYRINNNKELDLINKYCNMKNIEVSCDNIPCALIVTKKIAISIDELQDIVDKISDKFGN